MGWPGPAWLLGALFLLQGGCPGVSAHSTRYVMTAVSEPGQGLPQFITVAYLDDQLLGVYDSERRRIVSRVPWVQKTEQEDPQLWDMHVQRAQYEELDLRGQLATLQNLHNQSGGFHSLQYMDGCALSKDGWKGGRSQFAYDGRDYIAFDKETLTWTAASTKAQVTKRSWDANLPQSQYLKAYLEETCIEWLRKYLDYGKETLLRRVADQTCTTIWNNFGPLLLTKLKNIRRAPLDQAKGPSSPASCITQWPHQMPQGAHSQQDILFPVVTPLHLAQRKPTSKARRLLFQCSNILGMSGVNRSLKVMLSISIGLRSGL